MELYKDITGNSGVHTYEIGADYIALSFNDSDKIYRYSYRIPGKRHVEKMKLLAEKGKGLSTYISQHVRDNFESAE